MKKNKLMMLALMGLLSTGFADGEVSPDMRTFYESLSAESKEKFLKLDDEHRKMAIDLGENTCGSSSKCGNHYDFGVNKAYKDQTESK